jgi:hypothetical protein
LIDAYKHYIEARTELKPNTVAVYDRDMSLYLKDWHHLKITDVTMQMVIVKHAEISKPINLMQILRLNYFQLFIIIIAKD